MIALISTVLLVLGGYLLAVGLNTTESIKDEASRMVIARYDDRTIWFVIGGSLCFLLGLVGIFRGRRA
jgi:hypothetical protein